MCLVRSPTGGSGGRAAGGTAPTSMGFAQFRRAQTILVPRSPDRSMLRGSSRAQPTRGVKSSPFGHPGDTSDLACPFADIGDNSGNGGYNMTADWLSPRWRSAWLLLACDVHTPFPAFATPPLPRTVTSPTKRLDGTRVFGAEHTPVRSGHRT